MSIKSYLLDRLYEPHKVVSPIKIILKHTHQKQKGPKYRSMRNSNSEKIAIIDKKQRKERDSEEYIARRRFMTIPKDICLNDIQTSIFSLLYKIFPHLHPHPFSREETWATFSQERENPTLQKEKKKTKKESENGSEAKEWKVNRASTSGVLLG